MTHDILQTDIELAKELIASNRPADEVARALNRRGIQLPTATQLVDDLSNGRPVRPQMAAPEFVAAGRGSRRRHSTPPQSQGERSHPSDSRSSRTRPSPAPSSRRKEASDSKSSPLVWFAAGIFGFLVLTGGVIAFKHGQRSRPESQNQKPRNERPPDMEANARVLPASAGANLTPAQNRPSRATLSMEVRADGLYLSGTLLTKEQAWGNVTKVFGYPNRTNQCVAGDKQVFAYDQLGILLYGKCPVETESIVVDFDGSGGTNGTSKPFLGSLQVAGYSIRAYTDSASITRELKLQPKPDSLIISAEYRGTDVIFSYDSPEKLSIVEIGLK
jgi:hypothetical protein